MSSALLLGLLAFGAIVREPDPPVRIRLDRQDQGYQRGERVKVFLETRDDRYLVVFHVDPDRRLRVLFPLDPADDSYVQGGKTYKLINRGGREGFVAEVAGRGTIFAAASVDPFRFEEFVREDFWDYSALNPLPIEGDVEQALVELVQRMATGRFDYDILPYGAYADASEIAPGTDIVYEVEPALGGCLDCAPVSTVVVGPAGAVYCQSPLYDPMCYDPLYWSPGYVPPAYWNAGWGWYGGYYYGGYYAGGYYPSVPISPYQMKPWDRQWSGESPGSRPRVPTENVNTVVGQLPATGRILRADPRRTWGGDVPVAVPTSAPVPVPVSQPSAPAAPHRRGEAPVPTAAGGQRSDDAPSSADPRPRRSWSQGSPSGGSGKSTKSPAAPRSGNADGGGKSGSASQAAKPSGGGRRRG